MNALLGNALDTTAILRCCLEAESRVAGRHLDNIAPALLGGLVLVLAIDPAHIIRLPVPTGLRLVIAHPAQRLSTAKARQALPDKVALSLVTHQLAHVAAMIAACYTDDLQLFGRALDDRIAEPARASLMPGFVAAKQAALEAGALGASISGAGPTAFAVVDSVERGNHVATAMHEAYARHGLASTAIVTEIDHEGTIVKAC